MMTTADSPPADTAPPVAEGAPTADLSCDAGIAPVEAETAGVDAAPAPDDPTAPAAARTGWQRCRYALCRLAALAVVAVLAWGIGLVWFADVAGRTTADEGGTTDAIVVLTGGSVRVATGLRLLIEQRAPKLFVSGVHHGVDLADLLRVSQQRLGALECCVVLGHSADDTRGNARETARWVHAEGLRSLWLVTANYHMPRSLYEFARAMPDVEIRPYPVAPDAVHLDQWWRWPGTAELIADEYNKFLWAHVRGFVESLVDTGQS